MSRGYDHDDDLIFVWIAYFLIVKVCTYGVWFELKQLITLKCLMAWSDSISRKLNK